MEYRVDERLNHWLHILGTILLKSGSTATFHDIPNDFITTVLAL